MRRNETSGNRERLPKPPPRPTYEKGTWVQVHRDTTPGCLREAGVAQVTAVVKGSDGVEVYDVSYVHGRSATHIPVTALAPYDHDSGASTARPGTRVAQQRNRNCAYVDSGLGSVPRRRWVSSGH